MVVNSFTVHPYTCWGARYNSFEIKDEWKIFINLANKEKEKYTFHEFFKKATISHIIYWFDTNILQEMLPFENATSKITLDVRIRIVCGMINKIPPYILSRELKIIFMECIWDTYKKFYSRYNDWYCKWILELPF